MAWSQSKTGLISGHRDGQRLSQHAQRTAKQSTCCCDLQLTRAPFFHPGASFFFVIHPAWLASQCDDATSHSSAATAADDDDIVTLSWHDRQAVMTAAVFQFQGRGRGRGRGGGG